MPTSPQGCESTESGAVLYVALELSARTWLLASGVGMGQALRRKPIPAGDRAALQRELAAARARCGLAATAPVRSCYEAGRDGFWVHRLLTAEGVTNVVVDSSSIEVSRRARRAKTDRLDADGLWRLLWRYWQGEQRVWHVVAVPSEAVEEARHHEREVATLVTEQTRWRNRVQGLLATAGVRVRVDAKFPERLAAVRDWAGRALPAGLQARVLVYWAQWGAIAQALVAARRAQHAAVRAAARAAASAPGAPRSLDEQAAQLAQLRGIGEGTALTLVKEVFSRDLKNRRQVGALSGLVPVPYQSGARHHEPGISRAGLRHVRGLLVEVSWQWLRWQPASALTQWYLARFGPAGRRPRRVGIVAVARRLLIALWRYHQTGEVPAGAVLRPV